MNCSHPSRRGRRFLGSSPAFTLIELLAVVAIVFVLVAVIFSVSNASLRQAQSVKCVGNLRTIGTAMFAYAADNNGVLPQGFLGQYPNPPGTNWFEYLAPYVGLPTGASIGYNAMQCPAKSGFDLDYSMYGANYPTVIGLNLGQVGSAWMEPGARRLNGTTPSRAFMIADAQGGFVYTPTLWTLTSDYDHDGVKDSNNMNFSGLDFRHGGKANFFLVDGTIRQLTSAQWGKNDGNIWGENQN